MATRKQVESVDSVESVESVEALVLLDCGFGKAGEVALLPLADAQVGFAHGMLDLNLAAVQAAKAK